jgi:hypothetical protein
MMIVLLAEHASMNVLLKQYQKATSIKLIRMYALTVVHVQMCARLRLFIQHSITIQENVTGTCEGMSLFILSRVVFRLLQDSLNIRVLYHILHFNFRIPHHE